MSVEFQMSLDKYRNISELFADSEAQFADKVALVSHGTPMTYAQVAAKSQQLAHYLMHHLKIEKGDRVAVLLPNSMQFIISVSAILRIGAVVVNINPLYTQTEIHALLKDARPRAVIYLNHLSQGLDHCEPSWAPDFYIETGVADCFPWYKRIAFEFYLKYVEKRIPPVITIPTKKYHWRSIVRPYRGIHHFRLDINHDDVAFLQYTGGTSTGQPKAAMLTHGNIVSNILQCKDWILRYQEHPELLTVGTFLPLYHIFALTANFLVFYVMGSKNVLFMNPRDIKKSFQLWAKDPLHMIAGVNTLFVSYMTHPDFHKLPLSELKIVLGGGMTVQEHVAKQWFESTGCPISQAYGLTEASPAVCINPLKGESFDGTVGYPILNTLVKICDDAGQEVPQGQVGELWVKGPQVMKGYWNKPEATQETLTNDGWLKTGDIAMIHSSGKVQLVDRKKDIIIVSGFNVYPYEVEAVLAQYPAIQEVAVVGLQTKDGLERVAAFYVAQDGQEITTEELDSYCHQHLAAYKIPKQFILVPSIPKSHVGKILKRELIASFQEKLMS